MLVCLTPAIVIPTHHSSRTTAYVGRQKIEQFRIEISKYDCCVMIRVNNPEWIHGHSLIPLLNMSCSLYLIKVTVKSKIIQLLFYYYNCGDRTVLFILN